MSDKHLIQYGFTAGRFEVSTYESYEFDGLTNFWRDLDFWDKSPQFRIQSIWKDKIPQSKFQLTQPSTLRSLSVFWRTPDFIEIIFYNSESSRFGRTKILNQNSKYATSFSSFSLSFSSTLNKRRIRIQRSNLRSISYPFFTVIRTLYLNYYHIFT